MSFFKTHKNTFTAALSLCLSGLTAAGCTVQPLYGNKIEQTVGADGSVADYSLRANLASIAIDAPSDRFSQIVRNRLIFLLGGGKGEPSSPRYRLTMGTSYSVQEAVQVNVGDGTEREGRASSGTVIAAANYQLKEGDKLVQHRKRSVTSSFDRPRQEYANLQAEEDAKKRAAEELAESIYLSIAQGMVQKK